MKLVSWRKSTVRVSIFFLYQEQLCLLWWYEPDLYTGFLVREWGYCNMGPVDHHHDRWSYPVHYGNHTEFCDHHPRSVYRSIDYDRDSRNTQWVTYLGRLVQPWTFLSPFRIIFPLPAWTSQCCIAFSRLQRLYCHRMVITLSRLRLLRESRVRWRCTPCLSTSPLRWSPIFRMWWEWFGGNSYGFFLAIHKKTWTEKKYAKLRRVR